MSKYLDSSGLSYFWRKIKTYVDNAAGVNDVVYDSTNNKIIKTISGTTSDIVDLDSVNAGKVNNHTVNSDVPANAVFTDTTYGVATTSANGLMSSSDKQKLNSAITSITATYDNNGTVTINFS